jgi:folate-binding protein YgfZ
MSTEIFRSFELKNRTQLLFTGPDRLRYLNGQVTQDLRKLSIDRALPACVTSAKGRLHADVWISDLGDSLLVDAHSSVAESLMARMERYIVADDVVVEDQTLTHTLFHCLDKPSLPYGIIPAAPVQSMRLGIPGWDLRVLNADRDAAREALGCSDDSSTSWNFLRISNAVPSWGAELSEDSLPPEALLDRTHIDYHKGCYIGQEVISRIKSIGHVNRRLVLLKAQSAVDSSGSRLFDPSNPSRDSAHSIGVITSVTHSGQESLALAYLKRGAAPATVLSQNETLFQVREL